MPYYTLNPMEVAVLKAAARRGDPDETYGALIATLGNLVDQGTGQISVSREQIAAIQKFAFEAKKATWQASLLTIFGRTLGSHLGRIPEDIGHLTAREGEEEG